MFERLYFDEVTFQHIVKNCNEQQVRKNLK